MFCSLYALLALRDFKVHVLAPLGRVQRSLYKEDEVDARTGAILLRLAADGTLTVVNCALFCPNNLTVVACVLNFVDDCMDAILGKKFDSATLRAQATAKLTSVNSAENSLI